MILIIGQQPAKGKEGEPAFSGTRSGQVLGGWLQKAGWDGVDDRIKVCNLWNRQGSLPSSYVLRFRAYSIMLKHGERYSHFIVVGKVADKYMRELCTPNTYLAIPHPSGLNRKLNDPKVVQNIIKKLRKVLRAGLGR